MEGDEAHNEVELVVHNDFEYHAGNTHCEKRSATQTKGIPKPCRVRFSVKVTSSITLKLPGTNAR